jgi:hypothetical protein
MLSSMRWDVWFVIYSSLFVVSFRFWFLWILWFYFDFVFFLLLLLSLISVSGSYFSYLLCTTKCYFLYFGSSSYFFLVPYHTLVLCYYIVFTSLCCSVCLYYPGSTPAVAWHTQTHVCCPGGKGKNIMLLTLVTTFKHPLKSDGEPPFYCGGQTKISRCYQLCAVSGKFKECAC